MKITRTQIGRTQVIMVLSSTTERPLYTVSGVALNRGLEKALAFCIMEDLKIRFRLKPKYAGGTV